MTKFKNYRDFEGIYFGSHDGRNAKIQISERITYQKIKRRTLSKRKFFIQFWDLDRDYYCEGFTSLGNGHTLSNVTLQTQDGKGEKEFLSIMLHTWDAHYLTCIDIWNGIEFASFFAKNGDFSKLAKVKKLDRAALEENHSIVYDDKADGPIRRKKDDPDGDIGDKADGI